MQVSIIQLRLFFISTYILLLLSIYTLDNYFVLQASNILFLFGSLFFLYYIMVQKKHLQKSLEKVHKKELQVLQQARLDQMGEVISMIAHQWRQPLGAISATNIDLKMKLLLDTYDLEKKDGRQKCTEYFSQSLDQVEILVKSLTATIDDFKDFYKPNKLRNEVCINDVIEKALSIINASLKEENIIVQKEFLCEKKLEILDGEVMQVILNILKNAQDNFKSQSIKNRHISIATKDRENSVTIQIKDNGGGIANDVIHSIFDPYFSTKNEKNGTGLGLYMSKTIIEEHHEGLLSVANINDGVCFTIEIFKGDKKNGN